MKKKSLLKEVFCIKEAAVTPINFLDTIQEMDQMTKDLEKVLRSSQGKFPGLEMSKELGDLKKTFEQITVKVENWKANNNKDFQSNVQVRQAQPKLPPTPAQAAQNAPAAKLPWEQ